MQARFHGECATCDGSIRVGDEIVRDADGDWVHANADECEGEIKAQAFGYTDPSPVAICPLCNLQRPCWCPEAIQAPEDAADRALRRAKENANRDPWEGF